MLFVLAVGGFAAYYFLKQQSASSTQIGALQQALSTATGQPVGTPIGPPMPAGGFQSSSSPTASNSLGVSSSDESGGLAGANDY